ncbi:hypothetical protein [Campylobacter insulaenigrae]|uniref:hypothetical protein n=1 Tax=Campylobacter insulaenigrae TaxID=260714 RepID=UPI002153277B|nr:hypothetical protein [Campylobacter insulaenigrae]MCR6571386.1 hypothetical protein [Campylobacter insulaenigrae]MCR6573944.1 hypothetical protein [Campylobacter insulaenigrae]MCR6580184.1 hypothetical protein [Campylobacter insulaenigrae]MCR6586856.1 hypothetical protein [Campylobacter insulaenigrae]
MQLTAYQEGLNALCFVDLLSLENPNLNTKLNKSKNINISCIQDLSLNATFYKCEIASISFVLALLCKMSMNGFDDLDEGYLSAESCFGEEEALEILEFLQNARCIIFDKNLKKHKDYENIKFFLVKLCQNFSLDLICSDEQCEELKIQKDFDKLLELDNFDGIVVLKSTLKESSLHCSPSFALIAKVKDKDFIELKLNNKVFNTQVKIDTNLKGTVALYDYKSDVFAFAKAQIKVIK